MHIRHIRIDLPQGSGADQTGKEHTHHVRPEKASLLELGDRYITRDVPYGIGWQPFFIRLSAFSPKGKTPFDSGVWRNKKKAMGKAINTTINPI